MKRTFNVADPGFHPERFFIQIGEKNSPQNFNQLSDVDVIWDKKLRLIENGELLFPVEAFNDDWNFVRVFLLNVVKIVNSLG